MSTAFVRSCESNAQGETGKAVVCKFVLTILQMLHLAEKDVAANVKHSLRGLKPQMEIQSVQFEVNDDDGVADLSELENSVVFLGLPVPGQEAELSRLRFIIQDKRLRRGKIAIIQRVTRPNSGARFVQVQEWLSGTSANDVERHFFRIKFICRLVSSKA